MTPLDSATIAKYQGPDGTIYRQLLATYGAQDANAIAAAAATGDRTQLANAIELARGKGAERDTSFLDALSTQIQNDGILGATLQGLNSQLWANFVSFIKSPMVILMALVVVFSLAGGWQWAGKKLLK